MVEPAQWPKIGRRNIVLTMLRALGTTALVLLVYFLVPIDHRPHHSILIRLAVGVVFFVVAVAYEVRAIVRAERPLLRAVDALALLIPVFVVVFAWTYLTMANSAPASFSQSLDRVGALYFTVTVFSSVGFGDIVAKTDATRLIVTAQMLIDLAVIAVVARLLIAAARGTLSARRNPES